MSLDDPLADREPDAGSLVLLAVMETLEHLEDPFAVLGRDPDAVVGNEELPAARCLTAADGHVRGFAVLELDPVGDEVLENLAEQHRVGMR